MVETPMSDWTFFSNHAHVLFCLVQNPDRTMREVADLVGVTERAVQRIVTDLEEAGVLVREKNGRRNSYRFSLDRPLRHKLEAHRSIEEVIALIAAPDPETP